MDWRKGSNGTAAEKKKMEQQPKKVGLGGKFSCWTRSAGAFRRNGLTPPFQERNEVQVTETGKHHT